ncbi:uncharacterized protein LOC107810238 [Nicotiana tabacum]|uniref:Uncharacterized protein LOC107810238 n=1 Tax=Nicotiana tabacum TaxID=4097 RepID=A0A1S4BNL5_TOBAC|nr:uncharacterized protein LOC104089450 [Nicotiana tomentosiformis]XP_016490481.1 PREDICTED: uncharacterized protein LOC107810238 [Nicotiana tabacum]
MGGGAMLTPFTSTVGQSNNSSSFSSPHSLSSFCNTSFEESWVKNRCFDYEPRTETLDIESFDEKGTTGSPYDCVFGSVPSSWEVEKAMSDLQSFMSGCNDPKEEMNWPKAMLNPHQSTLLQSHGYARFYDAFHMLKNEPPIQRLVVSLASDRAVWEAMMNNKAVQNLKGSLICAAEGEEFQSSTEESDIGSLVVKWIMGITTSKLAELIQSLGSLLSEIFNEILEPAKKEKPTSELSDLLEEKIISSFLLSVVLLLIVVLTRTQGS